MGRIADWLEVSFDVLTRAMCVPDGTSKHLAKPLFDVLTGVMCVPAASWDGTLKRLVPRALCTHDSFHLQSCGRPLVPLDLLEGAQVLFG